MNNKAQMTKMCKRCKAIIPYTARVCPVCGKRLSENMFWKAAIAVAVIFTIIALGESKDKDVGKGGITSKQTSNIEYDEHEEEEAESEAEYKASCEEYKYKDVLRNPEYYVGERAKITVKISSVHEANWLNDRKYYFAYSNDEYDWWMGDRYGVFDARENQTLKLLEDDIITVYGEISDPEYTTSLIMSSSELFCIEMKYIDFISE